VEDATHLFADIVVRVRSILGGDQAAVEGLPSLMDVGGIVVEVTQQVASVCRQFLDEGWGHFVVRLVGWGEGCGQGNPYRSDGDDDVQLPAIDPTMPARPGPVGLGVNGSMGHHTLVPVFLVPYATIGL
jgi:hypothetical protein